MPLKTLKLRDGEGVHKLSPLTRKPVYVTSDPAFALQIEEFRFRNRFTTNAAAIRELLKFALAEHPLVKLAKKRE